MSCGLAEFLFGCPVQQAVDASLEAAITIATLVLLSIVIVVGIWAVKNGSPVGGALAAVFAVAILESVGLAVVVASIGLAMYLAHRGQFMEAALYGILGVVLGVFIGL